MHIAKFPHAGNIVWRALICEMTAGRNRRKRTRVLDMSRYLFFCNNFDRNLVLRGQRADSALELLTQSSGQSGTASINDRDRKES